jgi:hypothetical protein
MSTQQYFDYQEVQFISERLIEAFHLVQAILLIVTTCAYLILVYVVLFYSPKALGTYK